jgi:hypothetical protein
VQVGEAYGYNYKYAVGYFDAFSQFKFSFQNRLLFGTNIFHNKLPARGFVQGIYETNSFGKRVEI